MYCVGVQKIKCRNAKSFEPHKSFKCRQALKAFRSEQCKEGADFAQGAYTPVRNRSKNVSLTPQCEVF